MSLSVKRLTTAVSLALLSAGVATQVQAAGFALIENSASGMGNAYAGGAAIADDASTVWFNPAGLTRLKGTNVAIAGHIVSPTADFTNNGSQAVTTAPLSGVNDDGGETAFVPNFYYTTEIGNDTVFGFGVSVPFGLSTDYKRDWVGRYHATESEVQTINLNPSIGSKVTDKFSIGFGLNIQYIDATLANQLDSAAICQARLVPLGVPSATCDAFGLTAANIANPALDPNLDSAQKLTGDDWTAGYNFGFLYEIDDSARVGFAYRSSIKHSLEGGVNFSMNSGLSTIISGLPSPADRLFSNTGVTAGIELPESASVSYYRDVNEKLAIMLDLTWTKWSNFDELDIIFDNPVQPAVNIPENWDNNWRYAIGINYKSSEKWTFRTGVAYDETPIPSASDRTPRIPGNDRTWLSFGFGYTLSTDMSLDVGYSHLFVDDTPINNTDPSFGHTLTGEYDADVNILSAQLNMQF